MLKNSFCNFSFKMLQNIILKYFQPKIISKFPSLIFRIDFSSRNLLKTQNASHLLIIIKSLPKHMLLFFGSKEILKCIRCRKGREKKINENIKKIPKKEHIVNRTFFFHAFYCVFIAFSPNLFRKN